MGAFGEVSDDLERSIKVIVESSALCLSMGTGVLSGPELLQLSMEED